MNDIVYMGKHKLTFSVTRHAHSNWELIYCTTGTGVLQFDDFSITYGVGDIVVIPPQIPHTNVSGEGFTNIHLNMVDVSLPFKGPTVIRDDAESHILRTFSDAFYHFFSSEGQRALLISSYGNLIANYMLAYREGHRLSRVVSEIEGNIVQNFPDCAYELDDYLHSFPFSYDYLRKLFKKELGVTPHQYLMNKRLQTAAEMLCSGPEDGRNVAEIAHSCGFREPLYFSRMFKKKYDTSPTQYSREHAGEEA